MKYGFLWRCWDLGDGWTLGTVPPCLTQGGNGESGGVSSDSCGSIDVQSEYP